MSTLPITHQKSNSRAIVGWREWIYLPELGDQRIRAKIDTGARSSCIHASAYKVLERDAQTYVSFSLGGDTSYDLPIIDHREVKDSGGHIEQRPFVSIRARLGHIEWDMEMSLTCREGMRFPMLIGRRALMGNFIVDPQKSFLFGRVKTSQEETKREDELDETGN